MTKHPLEVAHLSVAYRQGGGWLRVVDDVSFAVAKGEVFGLVGESGCGKSTVALQLLGYRHAATRIETGEVRLNGVNILSLARPELDRLRGVEVSFVPQNPTTALNPGILIGEQVGEVLVAHGKFQGGDAADKRQCGRRRGQEQILPALESQPDLDGDFRQPVELRGIDGSLNAALVRVHGIVPRWILLWKIIG